MGWEKYQRRVTCHEGPKGRGTSRAVDPMRPDLTHLAICFPSFWKKKGKLRGSVLPQRESELECESDKKLFLFVDRSKVKDAEREREKIKMEKNEIECCESRTSRTRGSLPISLHSPTLPLLVMCSLIF